ncbi:unnamed protein product [Staurois parvus]|uniref:Uncharacterized protein n=1 Tax=Staurois parvus TaxID=386267 RepID=A0ABN9B5Q6_9NEOB|nr:unnamed protein product [Staurois parvus]
MVKIIFLIFPKIMTKKIQLQKTRHASYEVHRTVYSAKRGHLGGYLYCSDILGPQEIRLAVSTSGFINFQIYTIVCELYNFPTN